MTKDYRRELQGLLRKLFQFDSADLDFGIYRIMNYKRDEIEKFIEEDLIKAVDVEFEKYSAKSKEEIEKELEEIKKRIFSTLGEDALLPSGDIKEMYRGSPIAEEFYRKKENLKNNEMVDQHKAEIFSYIYQFLSRYYAKGDFISLRRWSRQNKYAIPYNGEEVLLHWANKDQFYIKTGEYFKNYSFRIGEYKINFRILNAEMDQNNNRSGDRFFIFKEKMDSIVFNSGTRELTILFEYRALSDEEKERYGTRDVQKIILKEIKERIISKIELDGLRNALQKSEEEKTLLEKHLLSYAERNTTDYFIHKDLKSFLSGELDFFIKNEVIKIDDLSSEKGSDIEKYISRVKVMKLISLKIIDFLAQIENFQKTLFIKKKFVLRSGYCLTINHVPEQFYDKIIANDLQIKEWRKLYGIDEQSNQTKLSGDRIDIAFLKSRPYLMLDTAFFDRTFLDDLLEQIQYPDGKQILDLDEAIAGLMVKSENWQALNLLQEKYREQIKCIYIDPPYNTGNDEFIYKDSYQHSSWLSMMADRLVLSKTFIKNGGVIFSSIDDNELDNLIQLSKTLFGIGSVFSTMIWKKADSPNEKGQAIATYHEYVVAINPNINSKTELNQKIKPEIIDAYPKKTPDGKPYRLRQLRKNGKAARRADRPNLWYGIKAPDGQTVFPIAPEGWEGRWVVEEKTYNDLLSKGQIEWIKRDYGWMAYYYEYAPDEPRVPFPSIIDDVSQNRQGKAEYTKILGSENFDTPKPSDLIGRILKIGTNDKERQIVLDFFAGSGTTAQAVLSASKSDEAGHNYILVEMGDHFETVMKPRIQKITYSHNWLNGRPQDVDGQSHIFKYMYLEQYEDTLNNIEFFDSGTTQRTLKELDGYFLPIYAPFETSDSPCRLNVYKLSRPFDYTLKITQNSEMGNEKVDLVDTFNYLLGLHVKRIKAFCNNGTYYKAIHGRRGDETITIIWRTTDDLNLEGDKAFIEDNILKEFKANKVYVNSDFFVDGALPIEPEFKRLMEA